MRYVHQLPQPCQYQGRHVQGPRGSPDDYVQKQNTCRCAFKKYIWGSNNFGHLVDYIAAEEAESAEASDLISDSGSVNGIRRKSLYHQQKNKLRGIKTWQPDLSLAQLSLQRCPWTDLRQV